MTTPRAIATLVERISSALRSGPLVVHALAIGGSRGAHSDDVVSDLDLVVLLDDGPLVQQTAELKTLLDPLLLTGDALGGGPSWKEGFGCRLSYLYGDGFKVEIFANRRRRCPSCRARCGGHRCSARRSSPRCNSALHPGSRPTRRCGARCSISRMRRCRSAATSREASCSPLNTS